MGPGFGMAWDEKNFPNQGYIIFSHSIPFSNSTWLCCMDSSIKMYPKIAWEIKLGVVDAFGSFAFETNAQWDGQPLQWLNPLLTRQLTWQFPIVDGPSKLGWDWVVTIVDGLASQGVIPVLYELAESYEWSAFSILNWLAKDCKRGTYSILHKQAEPVGNLSWTDWLF